jgi:hypothetical protein
MANLFIDQVYDAVRQTMISHRQAICDGHLDIESFVYTSGHYSMPIHQAFYHGLILGRLQTNRTADTASILMKKKFIDSDYDFMFSSLTNMINSLSEFRDTIKMVDQCELMSNGFIRDKLTDRYYLLSQAIELGFVSIGDLSPTHSCEHVHIFNLGSCQQMKIICH